MKSKRPSSKTLGIGAAMGVLVCLDQRVEMYAQKTPLGILEDKGISLVPVARVLPASWEAHRNRIGVAGVLNSTHDQL